MRNTDFSLPKSGPVQTSYEEKLQLYSLYKQGMSARTRPRRGGGRRVRAPPTRLSQEKRSHQRRTATTPHPGLACSTCSAAPSGGLCAPYQLTIRDSWAKQKGLSKRDAKSLYVGALLKVGTRRRCHRRRSHCHPRSCRGSRSRGSTIISHIFAPTGHSTAVHAFVLGLTADSATIRGPRSRRARVEPRT